MKKRIIAVILSLAMSAACLTACSEEKNEEKNTADTTTVTSAATAASEETKEGETTTTQEKTTTAKQKETTTASKQTTTQSETTKTEPAVKKRRMLSKAEYFDDRNKLYYLVEHDYTIDSDSGNIKEVVTQSGKKIYHNYESLKTDKYVYINYYDKDFNCLKTTDKDGGIDSEYVRDKNGKPLKYISYNNGELDYTDVYEYRSNGSLSKITRYNKNNKISQTSYYNKNEKIEKEEYSIGQVRQYKYDSKGNQVKNEVHQKGKIISRTTSKFNSQGNMTYTKTEAFSLDGDFSTISYEEEYERKNTDNGYILTAYPLDEGKRKGKTCSKTVYFIDNGVEKISKELSYSEDGKLSETIKYTYTEI